MNNSALLGNLASMALGAAQKNPQGNAALQNAMAQGMQGFANAAQNPAFQNAMAQGMQGIANAAQNNPELVKAMQGAAGVAAASPLASMASKFLGSSAPAAASPLANKMNSIFGSSAGTGIPTIDPPLTPQQAQAVVALVASALGTTRGGGKRRKTFRKKTKLRRKTGRVTRAV